MVMGSHWNPNKKLVFGFEVGFFKKPKIQLQIQTKNKPQKKTKSSSKISNFLGLNK
jgi:hypothetical protein